MRTPRECTQIDKNKRYPRSGSWRVLMGGCKRTSKIQKRVPSDGEENRQSILWRAKEGGLDKVATSNAVDGSMERNPQIGCQI